jgi:glycosyltransferase involved in cell wall biosynthesis
MLLSILIPVYNERTVVERSLSLVLAAPLPENVERELVIVDDCSTDGTSAILERLAAQDSRIRLTRHPVNRGKGAAVRTAIEQAQGDFCLIQDADLEYDPSEYPRLLKPLLEGHADAVFGSRYLVSEQTRVLPFWHSVINKTLTLISNIFSNLNVTDMETCYKVFRTDLLKSIPIRSDRFGFEPEITMKCAKRKLRVYEVPISYHGRTYEEGKKIGWKDGVKALGVVLYFWLVDDLYVPSYGRGLLNNLTGTPEYLSWITQLVRPHLGDRVLEIGAGLGNFTGRLMARKLRYVAAESDALYLHALTNRFLRTPSVKVQPLHPESLDDFAALGGNFDTALCLNVLEAAQNPRQILESLRGCLDAGGKLIVLAPASPSLFGSLDKAMGHHRRFSESDLEQLLSNAGFSVQYRKRFNKIGAFSWLLYGKLLSREHISRISLKLFDKTVWLWRRLDPLLPWRGLSMIVVAQASGVQALSAALGEHGVPQAVRQLRNKGNYE